MTPNAFLTREAAHQARRYSHARLPVVPGHEINCHAALNNIAWNEKFAR